VDKVVGSAREAVADIPDGATLLIGGFGVVQSWPTSLLEALRQHGARALTLVANTPGVGPTSPQVLAEAGQVRKLIASYAVYPKQRTRWTPGSDRGASRSS
jgi:acyl CoA:acetate/3-ketoacid CoA transferase alpha subunit